MTKAGITSEKPGEKTPLLGSTDKLTGTPAEATDPVDLGDQQYDDGADLDHGEEIHYVQPSTDHLPRRKRKKVNNFYSRQNSLLRHFSDDRAIVEHMEKGFMPPGADGVVGLSAEEQDAKKLKVDRILAQITFFINIGLLIAKSVVAGLTNSLTVISSVVDSAVDVTSGVVIWATTRAIESPDPYMYPRGRSKLEPLAVIIVAVVMAVASLQVIITSVTSITDGKVNPSVDIVSLIIMICVILIKGVLFIVCYRVGTPSALVLAQDHRNDFLSNIVAIIAAVLAEQFWIYLDPTMAILMALYIIVTWCITGAEQVPLLSGKSADPQMINRIIKLSIGHDPRILQLETVFAYHYGAKFLVELHIMMDEHLPLRETHDIAEALQLKLEHLPHVERAFIHCDYSPDTCKCVCGAIH